MTKKSWLGERFGRLVVTKLCEENRQKVECICDCGNTTQVFKNNLGRYTVSCGCRMNETKRKHSGLPTETPTHNSWENMLSRTNKTTKQHANSKHSYAGVKVCDRWRGVDGFKNFVADMGECPKGYSLDRVDTEKGYHAENCRWASRKQQQNNLRNNVLVTIGLCEYTIEEATIILGKTRMQVWHMKNKGELAWRYRYQCQT
jgi:hypothetical protein